jgi:hypothetical protein
MYLYAVDLHLVDYLSLSVGSQRRVDVPLLWWILAWLGFFDSQSGFLLANKVRNSSNLILSKPIPGCLTPWLQSR